MSHTLARIASVGAAAAATLAFSSGPASADTDPACDDVVAETLHSAHDLTGDPAGLIHEAEEIYCSVG